ncbi:hypothetical protein GCM10018791_63210 [Streptomyces zaomyceticus]|nr:hypothetical protein GCM10018791_63210 [Streptomyces zaomyceticus]
MSDGESEDHIPGVAPVGQHFTHRLTGSGPIHMGGHNRKLSFLPRDTTRAVRPGQQPVARDLATEVTRIEPAADYACGREDPPRRRRTTPYLIRRRGHLQ